MFRFKRIKLTVLLIISILHLLSSKSAHPEYGYTPDSFIDPAVLKIDEDKYLNTRMDRDYTFVDEKGEFHLKEMTGKPLIVVFAYYSCNGICPTANIKLKDALAGIERTKIGKDYRVLTLSFDKNDDIHSVNMFMDMTGLKGVSKDDWRVAILKNKEDIEGLTGSVGFKFFWSTRDQTFLHPNVYIFLSPEGRVVRYLYGTPPDKKDLELAITEANWGKAAKSPKVIDLITMACYSYNFKEGKYTLNYPVFIGFGSIILGLSFVLAGPLIAYLKRFKRKEAGL